MTELVDVTVEYNDSTGTKVTEQSVSLPWEKNFKEVKTPVTAKLIVSYKTKEGVTYDKEAYRISRDVRLSVTTTDNKDYSYSSPLNLTISKDKIADYIKEYLENKPDSISVDCKSRQAVTEHTNETVAAPMRTVSFFMGASKINLIYIFLMPLPRYFIVAITSLQYQ